MPDWLTGHFSTALICLGGFMALVFGSESRHDSTRTKRRWPWGKIGGAIAIIGGVLAAIGSGKQQGRLETLAGDTKALVTGGDSVVWVRLTEDSRKADTFRADLVHRGDVPAFDIDIEIVETGVCDGLEPWTTGQALTSGVGNPRIQFFQAFGPITVKSLRGHFEPTCDGAYYLVIIQTRNRSVVEQILLKKIDGKWHQAIRVQELYADKTVVAEIDIGFVASGEKVNWPDLKTVREILSSRIGN